MSPQDIYNELSDFGFGDLGSTALMRAINYALKNITNREPWPFMEKVTTLTFDGTNATPSNAPTDLRAVMKVIDTTSGKRIHFKRTDDLEEQYGTSLAAAGTPYFYYFEGGTLKFYQIPPSTQTLRLRYLRSHPTVAQGDPESAILIPSDFHEAVALRAMMRLYDQDDDTAMSARVESEYENVLAQMQDSMWAQQHDEPEYVHMIDADDYDYFWPTY